MLADLDAGGDWGGGGGHEVVSETVTYNLAWLNGVGRSELYGVRWDEAVPRQRGNPPEGPQMGDGQPLFGWRVEVADCAALLRRTLSKTLAKPGTIFSWIANDNSSAQVA